MRLFLLGLAVLLAAASPARAAGTGYCTIASRCASIVVDAASGSVIASSEADKQVHPASLTKVMTLYLLFEAIDRGRFRLTDTIPISARAAAQAPTKIGLRPGQRITVEDAIEAVAVKSANDIAVAVAEAVGGSESAFVARMNEKARQLGMTRTTFRNPSGLPDSQQKTTARDMATLARRTVLDFSRYRPYFGLTAATVAGQRIQGHNRLLKSGECTGGKTGYINASGYNLVAWKEQNGRIVIGAVFGGNSISARDRHMASLLRSGFDHTTPIRMAAAAPPPPAPPPERPETVTETVTEAVAEAGLAATAPQIEESEDSRDEDMLDELIVATSTTSPTFDQSWAIQVGAYRDAVQAQQALAQATRSVPVILGAAFPRTIATATTMGQLHRAQLIGLDEQGAKSACATLTRQGMQCLAMPPGQNS